MKLTKPILFNNNSRILTHIFTDKPIYKLGDTVFIRGVMLDALTQKPRNDVRFGPQAAVKILGPGGDLIATLSLNASLHVQNSVWCASWVIPVTTAGGDYTIKVEYPTVGFATAVRNFEIRAFANPRLNSELDFIKKAYGPGEKASATLNVVRAEGGYPKDAKVTFTARIDGKEVFKGSGQLDEKGYCFISFDLPKDIEKGDGTLIATIQDGGVIETASKTIPIILQALDVHVYPEGGDFVCGLECGFYVQCYTPTGQPADMEADIYTGEEKVGSIVTKHEGRGKGYFTPQSGKSYFLKVTKPSGVVKTVPLPTAKDSGVVIQSLENVYECENLIKLKLSATKAGKYRAVLYKKDQDVCSIIVSVPQDNGSTFIYFTPPSRSFADGVLRVTVYDLNKVPMAERLIFRKPLESLKVQLVPDYKSYCPGDKVKLRLFVTDSSGKGVPGAVVCLTVTDESVLKMVEKRKRRPRLPTMALIEHEVEELEDATIYLSEDPLADLAIDLLLGTQGWRRFVFLDPEKFLKDKTDKAERILGTKDGEIATNQNQPPILQRRNVVKKKCKKVERNIPAVPLNVFAPAPKPMKAVALKPSVPPQKAFAPAPMNLMAVALKPSVAKPIARKQVAAPQKFDLPRFRIGGLVTPPVVNYIREYAHKIRENRKPGEREDFTETLLWSTVVTDTEGRAQVSFDLSDSVTTFTCQADTFSANGLLGASDKQMVSKEPLYVEFKPPVEVTAGDLLHLPILVVNSSQDDHKVNLKYELDGKGLSIKKETNDLDIKSTERKAVPLDLVVNMANEKTHLSVKMSAGAFADTVKRSINVVPFGFPTSISNSGTLNANDKKIFKFTIPDSVVPASLTTSLEFFTSPASNLTAALEALLREPYGCFEQTSSTTYPTIMAQIYFMSHTGVSQKIINRTKDLLEKGYKRLISYECRDGGYEWFGSSPGHEALTAYGVLEFLEMSKVYPVDQQMLDRTLKWLLGRRDGKGGFLRNTRALDSFGRAPPHITNAYIVWSLTESNIKGLEKEVLALYEQTKNETDPYFLALTSASLYNIGKTKEAEELAKKLTEFQKQDGHVSKAQTTITCSGATAKDVETTSISVIAWLKDYKQFALNIAKGIEWIHGHCQKGRFFSTQGTVLALKAIIGFDAHKGPTKEGTIKLIIDSKLVASVPFGPKTDGTIKLPSFANLLTKGEHILEIEMENGCELPFTLSIDFNDIKPESSEECVLDLETQLVDQQVTEGEGTEMNVSVKNKTDKGYGMTVAIIGIPGGLEPRHGNSLNNSLTKVSEQLKEFVKGKVIDFYEIRGREVILYWREIAPNKEYKVPISLIAKIPGEFTAPASRTYLYYTDEFKKWVAGTKVKIVPKAK